MATKEKLLPVDQYLRAKLVRVQQAAEGLRQIIASAKDPNRLDSTRTNLAFKLGLIAQIDRALERYQRGEYNTCAQCKKRIEPKRLLQIPETEHCLACARQLQPRRR